MASLDISELSLVATVARMGSLSLAALDLGITVAAVSKRLATLEARLGARLFTRTTRRIATTEEGEVYLRYAERILAEWAEMEDAVSAQRVTPRGLVRVASLLGFGRTQLAPAISTFARRYPEVEVQLTLTDRPLTLAESGHDLAVRVGNLPDGAVYAKPLARNDRVLTASPAYLKRAGMPADLQALRKHRCLLLRDNDNVYGVWRLNGPRGEETIKVRGALSSNHGEAVHQWAVDGHGIMLRSLWDVADDLKSKRLIRILPEYAQSADIYAVYSERSLQSARVKALLDFLAQHFAELGSRWTAKVAR